MNKDPNKNCSDYFASLLSSLAIKTDPAVDEASKLISDLSWSTCFKKNEVARSLILTILEKFGTEVPNHCGRRILHYAARIGDVQATQLILDKKANINCRAKDGETPLMAAAVNGRSDVVQLLLEKGAKVHYQYWSGRYDALDLAMRSSYSDYRYEDHIKIIKLLINAGSNINSNKPDCKTALKYAACHGSLELTRFLIEKGADLKLEGNKIALIIAAQKGHTEIVKLLLEKGVDSRFQDQHGDRALYYAFKNGHKDTVDALLSNKRINLSHLWYAIRKEQVELVELLLDSQTDINYQDVSGRTFLHYAVLAKSKMMVELLINKGIRVNIKDKNNESPLSYALRDSSYFKVIKPLLDANADIQFKNKKGNNPLHIVLSEFKDLTPYYSAGFKILRMFFDKGSSVKEKNNYGKSVLDLCNDPKLLFLLCSSPDVIQSMVNKKANLLIKHEDTVCGLITENYFCDREKLRAGVKIFKVFQSNSNKVKSYNIHRFANNLFDILIYYDALIALEPHTISEVMWYSSLLSTLGKYCLKSGIIKNKIEFTIFDRNANQELRKLGTKLIAKVWSIAPDEEMPARTCALNQTEVIEAIWSYLNLRDQVNFASIRPPKTQAIKINTEITIKEEQDMLENLGQTAYEKNAECHLM
ncbi:hypothetical protein phytr_11330 [Candidatus Phycorickettsia trachydisci]|uniref:Uncharacterized protein n=1 Tax=Candidatus Phycorickettsia trachydisci TaxID=2115978 RepID=A0A2P1P9W6_9RICK|nr:ankyrin repeat domain-containing protein [Candidatus Phycorickettsia trachydisci]AVP88058.1 hypothetical protein phytr_11330 [Candidatus Phycorickettsia trachydisci]